MGNFGFHRAIEPIGVFPQAANRLNCELPIIETELLIEVQMLNIDSNSYRHIREVCKSQENIMKDMILKIISEKGKMHNPVTNSGGMLTGKIIEVGSKIKSSLKVGDIIATLASLTLTPLKINQIISLKVDSPQIEVSGHAILFDSAPAIKLPSNIKYQILIAALDVCGAPKLTQVYSKDAKNILILGAGKSGILSAFAAFDSGVPEITIIENSLRRLNDLYDLKLPFNILNGDAKDYIYFEKYQEKFDLTLDCLNIPNAEMASIIATKKEGTIIFFNTATSFTQAALGAEGICNNVRMIIGNGYYPEHAEYTFEIIRKYPVLLKLLNEQSR